MPLVLMPVWKNIDINNILLSKISLYINSKGQETKIKVSDTNFLSPGPENIRTSLFSNCSPTN